MKIEPFPKKAELIKSLFAVGYRRLRLRVKFDEKTLVVEGFVTDLYKFSFDLLTTKWGKNNVPIEGTACLEVAFDDMELLQYSGYPKIKGKFIYDSKRVLEVVNSK